MALPSTVVVRGRVGASRSDTLSRCNENAEHCSFNFNFSSEDVGKRGCIREGEEMLRSCHGVTRATGQDAVCSLDGISALTVESVV